MSTLTTLKTYFETGDKPTQSQFSDLIDSLRGTGWASYSDGQYTVDLPFTIATGVTSSLPNNAATVINTHLPYGVTTFYDGTKITPENVGDYYVFTIRFKAKATLNTGAYFDFGIDIGGTQGVIFKESILFAKGANVEQSFSIDTPGFALDTFIDNGGTPKITSHAGTMSIYNIELEVARTHKSV